MPYSFYTDSGQYFLSKDTLHLVIYDDRGKPVGTEIYSRQSVGSLIAAPVYMKYDCLIENSGNFGALSINQQPSAYASYDIHSKQLDIYCIRGNTYRYSTYMLIELSHVYHIGVFEINEENEYAILNYDCIDYSIGFRTHAHAGEIKIDSLDFNKNRCIGSFHFRASSPISGDLIVSNGEFSVPLYQH